MDTGNLASEFFSAANREKVLDLYDLETAEDRETLRDLHQRFNVILRILNSKEKIHVDDFEKYCHITYCKAVEAFPWMELNKTLHKFLAHGAQIMRLHGGTGLAQWSEGPLEGSHKYIRKFRENLSRKMGDNENITDVFNRIYMMASPLVRSLTPKCIQNSISEITLNYNDDKIIESFINKDD